MIKTIKILWLMATTNPLHVTGIVDSTDQFFASVEIESKLGCPPILMELPLTLFLCEIKEGDNFKIIMLTPESEPVIICSNEKVRE